MILQRLSEHYDRIAASGDKQLPPPGFSPQKISFCVVLESDGRLNSFQSLQEQVGKVLRPRMMIVPGQAKPSGKGLNPCFLWDRADYMLGFAAEQSKKERARKAFLEFRDHHLSLRQEIDHPAFDSVCAFLSRWMPEMAEEHSSLLVKVAQNFGVFRIVEPMAYVHELIMPPRKMEDDEGDRATEESIGTCLVTGKQVPLARLHKPAIKNIIGGEKGGAPLVSFNKAAYWSYRKQQSYNAPVGKDAVFRYATALNRLLERKDRRISLGDATVVFWADHQTIVEDCLSELFADAPASAEGEASENQERVRQTRHFLTQLRDGAAEHFAIERESRTNFFILGLSPNASRLSVRLWVEADVAELEKRLGKHLQDIQLQDGREDDRPLTLWRIVAATGRAEFDSKGKLKKFDTDSVSPQLAGDLARSVLTGAAYPQSLLSTMLRRIRSDGAVHYARVASIKACLVRNSRLRGNPIEASMKLDMNNSDTAYCCGRLFALLEKIQTDSADGELNTTIKDRYFSSASTTPAVVFPRLFRLSQHHMAKLETGNKIYYERMLGEVVGKISNFPRQLALEEQAKFVIGYFHQRQDLYTSKKDKTQGASA
ncbi:MAG TPA: type I-C CRISPR-associated protein Cas8c/Csd1 [Clostridia bacterium]|nr:type I-C CRISPR-associated protein Cas8c/Csd1 [Clostridia bacterium]